MVRSHPIKKTNPDLRRQTQMPAPAIETLEAELRRYLEPEHFKPIQSYHQIPEKLRRDRLLTLPVKVVLTQLNDFNAKIVTLFESIPDAELFSSLPGAGPHLAPRLLVAFGAERNRFSSAQAFMSYVDIAPVKEESGKKRWVHWRWACPIFLRQTFVEWVNQSRRFSPWAQAFYQQQKRAGKSHQTAIRSLAYKWGRILWRCWQDNTPYDEQKYLAALARKKSPLIKLLGANDKECQTFSDA
jgi:transposase